MFRVKDKVVRLGKRQIFLFVVFLSISEEMEPESWFAERSNPVLGTGAIRL